MVRVWVGSCVIHYANESPHNDRSTTLTTHHPVLKTNWFSHMRNLSSFSKSRFLHRIESVLEGTAPPQQWALSDFQVIFRVFSRINAYADLFHFLFKGNPESLSQLRPPSVSAPDSISVSPRWCRADPRAKNTQICCAENYQNAGFITLNPFFFCNGASPQLQSRRAAVYLEERGLIGHTWYADVHKNIYAVAPWHHKQAVWVGKGLCNYQMSCHYRPRVVFYYTCHNRHEKQNKTNKSQQLCFDQKFGVFPLWECLSPSSRLQVCDSGHLCSG